METKENENKQNLSVINYKNNKYYNTAKYPIRQPIYLTWLIWVLSKMMLVGKKFEVDRVNMDGIKPPYMLLSNHMSFIDFELVSVGTYPQRMNNVVNIDGYYKRPWLMEWIGSIGTRKFTQDLHLVKSIKKVLSRGDVLTMYPEARYSPCGTTSSFPDTVANLIKKNNVPVVVAIHRGNHLHSPVWNYMKKRNVPLHTTITQILSKEQVESMTATEINEKLREAFQYDDYQYQKDNNILITEAFRAEGLHKILYQCPHCKTEFSMSSEGAEIFCEKCGKRWLWQENGYLKTIDGETEFNHIPDWYEWQREQVREQILNKDYYFEDDVDVYSQPHCWKYRPLGRAKLVHDIDEGFILKGNYRDKDYCIQRFPIENMALHVEYDFAKIKKTRVPDCIDISTEKDSFYCYPTNPRVVTKLALATEELFKIKYQEIKTNNKKSD